MDNKKNENKECDCTILDIDNCLLDSRKWLAITPINGTREEWDSFISKAGEMCVPNFHFIEDFFWCMLDGKNANWKYIFVTGRENRNGFKEKTIKMVEDCMCGTLLCGVSFKLLNYGANFELYMRDENDYRPSHEVKRDILKKLLQKHTPDFFIDDEEANCEVAKEMGVSSLLYDINRKFYRSV